MAEFMPSPAQQAFFDWIDHGEGSCILEAVAGAGKTTTVLEGVKRMEGRVWLGVYNKKMGDEIRAKIAARPDLSERKGLYTSTFHSAGFSALRFAYKNVTVDDKKTRKIAESIVAADRADLAHLVTPVVDCVSMAKNRGIGALTSINDHATWADMANAYDLDASLPEDASLEQLIKMSQVVLRRSNDDRATVDFDDMIYVPILRGMRMLTHDWVLVDEAQDTNPMRRMMARKLLRPGGRLVGVGDARQSIFAFTGADNDSLEQLAREFCAVRIPLTVSYRCPVAVVAHARAVVSHIEPHENAPAGSVTSMPYADMLTSVTPGDAVLCRFNKHLVDTCFRLIRSGVPAKIEGRAIGKGLLNIANRFKTKSLDTLARKIDAWRAKEVARLCASDNSVKADRIEDQCETLLVLIDQALEQGKTSVDDLRAIVESMFSDGVGASVTLCSVHKSKGLEWSRVFLLGRNELMPSPRARTDAAIEQENNLIYVAITRAKRDLVEVSLDVGSK